MMRKRLLAAAGILVLAGSLGAQPARVPLDSPAPMIEQPDAERTRQELAQLLDHYPPNLREVFALDPNLLTNDAYMAPYPALKSFLAGHPEVVRNPNYFVPAGDGRNFRVDRPLQKAELWRQIFNDLGVFTGFAMAIGLLTWLVRTLIDYRRWQRLSRVQTEVHTRILDRFTDNADLLAYIQSPAGSRFLQSAPIALDEGPRSMGAPLGRILWAIQAGLVLTAAGIGLQIAADRITEEAAQPLHLIGIVGLALGLGFVASAAISFLISRHLGLIEHGKPARQIQE